MRRLLDSPSLRRIPSRLLVLWSALALVPAPGFAQSVEEADPAPELRQGGRLEEIIVTAQKRSESLQEVPIAISAFNEESIERTGFDSVSDLAFLVPTLQFSAFTSLAAVSLRGVSYENTTPGGDPGVAMHLDGVYLGRPVATIFDSWDLESVEVLRGPQGTLYGRNATGGSINFITKRPTEEREAKLDVTYGNYDRFRLRGIANIPFTESVMARVSGTWEDRDGYQKNKGPGGTKGNDAENVSLRGSLLTALSENTELMLSMNYSDIGGVGNVYERRFPFETCAPPGPCAVLPSGAEYGGPGPNNQPQLVNDLQPNLVFKDTRESSDLDFRTVSGTLIHDFNGMTLKTITAYADMSYDTFTDLDGSSRRIMEIDLFEDQRQFSQEIQLSSSSDGPLRWLLGAFYFTEDADRRSTIVNDDFQSFAANSGIGFSRDGVLEGFSVGGDVESKSYALFTQLDYDILDTVTLTGGFRFTRDEKKADLNEFSPFGPVGNFVPPAADNPCPCLLVPGQGLVPFGALGGPPVIQTGNLVASDDETWSEPTYKVGVNWAATDTMNLFGSYSRGYKSGGVNLNGATIAEAFYDPEFIDSFEVGAKMQFLDRIQVNLAAHYSKIDDLQFQVFGTGGAVIENAAEATVAGVELESQWLVTDALEFNGSVGYLDAEYDDFQQRLSTTIFADRKGNKLNRAPEWTLNVGGQYSWELGNLGRLTLRADYHWQDEQFFQPDNTEQVRADGYYNLDLRAFFQTYDDKWSIEAYATNVTDQDQIGDILRSIPFLYGGVDLTSYKAPRMFGLRVGYTLR